jgi:Cu/Ag efflux protein CusF
MPGIEGGKMRTLFLAATLTLSVQVFANHAPFHGSTDSPQGSARQQTSAALSEGEVRRVDRDARKITIRHGPLANLEMPAMTMVFSVKDPAMLEQVKVGDRIRFQAEKIDGAFTVTQLESAP